MHIPIFLPLISLSTPCAFQAHHPYFFFFYPISSHIPSHTYPHLTTPPPKPIPLSKPSYFSHHLFSLYTTCSSCTPIPHSPTLPVLLSIPPSCILVVHISATPTPSRSCMAMHSYVIPISPQNPFSSTHAWPLQPLHLFLITTRSYSPHPSSMPSCLSSPPPCITISHLPIFPITTYLSIHHNHTHILYLHAYTHSTNP